MAAPLEAGAVQLTATEVVVDVGAAVTAIGAPGAAAGVAVVEAAEAVPVPELFDAVTVKVYPVPLVRPETVQVVAPAVVQVKLPGDEVTVYPVIAEPPVPGAVQDTTDEESAFDVAVTPVGVPGTVAEVMLLEAALAGLVPAPLVAVTLNVYAVPAVRPVVIVHVVATAPDAVQVPPAGLEVTV